jgi:amino acid transporter
MPAWIRRWVYAAGSACFLTGILWLLFHYFIRHEGDFGPEAHPLEHIWLTLHGGAAIAMAWVFGLMWLGHIRRGWQKGRNLKSGITMASIMLTLIFSGWGLYYLSNEQWREYTGFIHWGLGLFAGLWLPIHIWRGRLSAKK